MYLYKERPTLMLEFNGWSRKSNKRAVSYGNAVMLESNLTGLLELSHLILP